MKYTVAQIRSLTEIPSQTLRLWREKLAPIQGRNGYTACFTAGDALALKIIQRLTGEIGLPVGRLIPMADDLFSICQGGRWSVLEESCLQLDLSNDILKAVPLKDFFPNVSVNLLLLPLAEEIIELRIALMPEAIQQNSQQELHFPPTPLTGRGNTV